MAPQALRLRLPHILTNHRFSSILIEEALLDGVGKGAEPKIRPLRVMPRGAVTRCGKNPQGFISDSWSRMDSIGVLTSDLRSPVLRDDEGSPYLLDSTNAGTLLPQGGIRMTEQGRLSATCLGH